MHKETLRNSSALRGGLATVVCMSTMFAVVIFTDGRHLFDAVAFGAVVMGAATIDTFLER